jgi:hypothetical protein
MSDFKNLGVPENQIKCVDDVPEAAHIAERQQFFVRRGKWIAMVPLIPIFALDKHWQDGETKFILTIAALSWAIAVVCYGLYLMLAVRCPRCRNQFGFGENCRNCDLPRHHKLQDNRVEVN